jgi:hypothetical protein
VAPPEASSSPVVVVARRLQPLGRPVVFVGGAIVVYLLDTPPVGGVRVTYDVDVVVDVATRSDHGRIEAALRRLGFRHDTSPGAPICRWKVDGFVVDIMATDPELMGFGNRWYREAQATAEDREIAPGVTIKLIRAPYFLATKLEAFAGRGEGDYQASHDLEDLITVLDGRAGLLVEVRGASPALQAYLQAQFAMLLAARGFVDALPGHLSPDDASQARLPIVLARLRALASLDDSP